MNKKNVICVMNEEKTRLTLRREYWSGVEEIGCVYIPYMGEDEDPYILVKAELSFSDIAVIMDNWDMMVSMKKEMEGNNIAAGVIYSKEDFLRG